MSGIGMKIAMSSLYSIACSPVLYSYSNVLSCLSFECFEEVLKKWREGRK